MTEIDVNTLRDWIGRQDHATELLTPTLVARLGATMDRETDLDDGAVAPLLVHHCLCQPAAPTAALGPDGHPARGGFLPPVPLPRRMWASSDIRFHGPLRIGDVVSRRSEVTDITAKEGRSGSLCFVIVTHEISTPTGPALTEEQTIVYRGASRSKPAPTPAPTGAERRSMGTEPERLFRFSALTFNSHRIHYDAPYATETENYPGLVVHGPLQAMALAQFAADLRGAPPARFRFRGLTPMISGAPMELHANAHDHGMVLWTARANAPTAMEAQAWW